MDIGKFISEQPVDKVLAVKKRLAACISQANNEDDSTDSTRLFEDAINHLDTDPKKLNACNSLMRGIVKAAFESA